jgi:hypothetical protein
MNVFSILVQILNRIHQVFDYFCLYFKTDGIYYYALVEKYLSVANTIINNFGKEEIYAYYIHGVIFELQTPLNLAELIRYISILYNYMYELKFELYTPEFFSVRMEINYLVHWHVASDFSTKS